MFPLPFCRMIPPFVDLPDKLAPVFLCELMEDAWRSYLMQPQSQTPVECSYYRWYNWSTVFTHAEYDVSLRGFTVVCLSAKKYRIYIFAGPPFSFLCLASPAKENAA